MPFTDQQLDRSPPLAESQTFFPDLSDSELIFHAIYYLIQCYELLGEDEKTLTLLQFAWPYYYSRYDKNCVRLL
jgi:hypothetical protein